MSAGEGQRRGDGVGVASGMGGVLVLAVAPCLQLKRGVGDGHGEVPSDALPELVQNLRQVPVMKAGVVDDDLR